MKLKEAVDNFAYRLGKSTDKIAKLKIEDDILVSWATIVERKINKRNGIYSSLYSSIVVPLEDAKKGPLPSSELFSNNAIMRTKFQVPRVLVTAQQDCGYIVTSENGEYTFTYIRPDRIRHRNTAVSKFIAELSVYYYTLIDRIIYVYGNPKTIRISGIPANPKEWAAYQQLEDNEFKDVFIDNDLFRGIKALMIEEYSEYAPLKKEEREIEVKDFNRNQQEREQR